MMHSSFRCKQLDCTARASAGAATSRQYIRTCRHSSLHTPWLQHPLQSICPHIASRSRPSLLASSSQDQPIDPDQSLPPPSNSKKTSTPQNFPELSEWTQDEGDEDELGLEAAREQQEEYLDRLGAYYDQRAPFRFGSPEDAPNANEQLLEHASVEVTTAEEFRLYTVGDEDLEDDDERETFFNVTPVRWLFSLSTPLADCDGLTYNQKQLQVQGYDPQQYRVGARLAMWVGCREFLSTSEMVHLKDQFPFLTWLPQELRWKEELEPSVEAEDLLEDILNLNQNVKFTPFYPLYFLGASEGSDMLPCIFQLKPGTSLTSGNVFSLLGISAVVARLFPRPLAFKSGADFIKYLTPRVEKGSLQFQQFLDESMESGALDGEDVEEINELEHFDEWLDCLKFFAEYAKPPFLLVVAGNANLGFDRVPVFFLGGSPRDPSRVVGAVMGLSWDEETSISLK